MVTAAADAHDARLDRPFGWWPPWLMLMMLAFAVAAVGDSRG